MRALAALLGIGASLHVTVWPHGGAGPHHAWTLRCGAHATGTLRQPAVACARLARLKHPFAPVPRGVACSDIYGGPQTALVTGTLRGHRVRARFSRRNGCEIERWNRVRFLLR